MSCTPCKVWHQLQWHNRLMLEAAYNRERPLFLTLTYSPEYLPKDDDDCLQHTQKFWKRLRKKYGCRYFCVTERGTLSERLHHHAIAWVDGFSRLSPLEAWTRIAEAWQYGFVGPKNGYDRKGRSIFVQSHKALRYTAKYVQKDCLKYTWSQRPVLGNTGCQRWRQFVLNQHAVTPFKAWTEVPQFINRNVLGRAQSMRVPERHFRRVVQEMGVPYAPENQLLKLLAGVPSGPIRKDLLEKRLDPENPVRRSARNRCDSVEFASAERGAASRSDTEFTGDPLVPESLPGELEAA